MAAPSGIHRKDAGGLARRCRDRRDSLPLLPWVTANQLSEAISQHVNAATSGCSLTRSAYVSIGKGFASHQSVNHSKAEYVRGNVSTNMAEGYFAQLKRSIDGTHHQVSVKHLPRYLGEFDFRYSTCKMSDYGRMWTLVQQMEGRLSYSRLIGSHHRYAFPGFDLIVILLVPLVEVPCPIRQVFDGAQTPGCFVVMKLLNLRKIIRRWDFRWGQITRQTL